MEAALRTPFVDRHGIYEDTIKGMEDSECLTIANFANWVDARPELKGPFPPRCHRSKMMRPSCQS